MTQPHYQDDLVTIHHGDCLDVMRQMPDASVHAVVTDPPYGLEFMGREWDGADGFRRSLNPADAGRENVFGRASRKGPEYRAGALFQEWSQAWAAECLRVLKPGGHLLAFGGTRTWHRLAVAIEDAGFEIRDSIAWLYGSGFSKSWNFSTMYAGQWCDCGGNAVPSDHASNADLLGLRSVLHAAAVPCGEGEDADLFSPMQREAPRSGVGEARAQGASGVEPRIGGCAARADERGNQPGMAGRDVPRAGEGLPDGADAGAPTSTSKRVRGRAPVGHGVAHRAPGDAAGGGASHQRGPGGQSTGEPAALPRPHESLDDGALRHGAVCARCGGLDPAYRGFGTGLKPAFEPIVVARKPLAGTVAQNVLAHGTGALNVDSCRVSMSQEDADFIRKTARPNSAGEPHVGDVMNRPGAPTVNVHPAGRWPTNVVLDDTAAAELDLAEEAVSRFFPTFRYEAKAPTEERPRAGGVAHPTVKPLDLMRWLVRLVTPPGGTVLDPFAGSGTTAEACVIEGFRCVTIEREADYLPLILARLTKPIEPVLDLGALG